MKHTDKMAFYDNMLAELKELRAKTSDRRSQNDLLFIEIVWNYYLYKNFPGQTDGLEHILKSRRFSLTEFARGCSGRFPRLGYLPFVAAVYFDRAAMYFSAAKCLKAFKDRLTDIFCFRRGCRCPCCGGRFKRFADFNYPGFKYNPCLYPGYSENTICPKCYSLPRHRIIARYFNRRREELKNKKILIFGMRSAEHRWLDRLGIKYQTADPYGGAELKYDIQNIDCADRQYDVVICNHVLEHVADWHKALREVYRVLREDGLLVLTVPTLWRFSRTFEGEPAASMVEKIFYYGQFDHLRIFGADIRECIEDAGFRAEAVKGGDLPRKIRAVRGPAEYDDNIVWLCRK